MTQATVGKMREYRMYVLFFILCDWGKRFAEAHSPHYAVLPLGSDPVTLRFRNADIVRNAINDGRVIDFNKEKRAYMPVIAGLTRVGNIADSALADNIARFRKEIKAFREKTTSTISSLLGRTPPRGRCWPMPLRSWPRRIRSGSTSESTGSGLFSFRSWKRS